MIRARVPGEQIGAGDVVLIGDKAFPVASTCLIGMPVLCGLINAVYTSEPVTTLQEPFPAKPAKPACENCEASSEYQLESAYLCRDCFEELRESD
jgi:hypothetical protein